MMIENSIVYNLGQSSECEIRTQNLLPTVDTAKFCFQLIHNTHQAIQNLRKGKNVEREYIKKTAMIFSFGFGFLLCGSESSSPLLNRNK